MTPLDTLEERALCLIGQGLAPEAATPARLAIALELHEDAARQVTRVLKRTGLVTAYGDGWKLTTSGRQYLDGPRQRTARGARVAA